MADTSTRETPSRRQDLLLLVIAFWPKRSANRWPNAPAWGA